jgi:hypothetical protein
VTRTIHRYVAPPYTSVLENELLDLYLFMSRVPVHDLSSITYFMSAIQFKTCQVCLPTVFGIKRVGKMGLHFVAGINLSTRIC